MSDRDVKSDAGWQRQPTRERHHVTRKMGTERSFTGASTKAAAKGDSGTGWPSFFAPNDPVAVGTETHRKMFVERTEGLCSRCAHLARGFPDDPEPTGRRSCVSAASSRLMPENWDRG